MSVSSSVRARACACHQNEQMRCPRTSAQGGWVNSVATRDSTSAGSRFHDALKELEGVAAPRRGPPRVALWCSAHGSHKLPSGLCAGTRRGYDRGSIYEGSADGDCGVPGVALGWRSISDYTSTCTGRYACALERLG